MKNIKILGASLVLAMGVSSNAFAVDSDVSFSGIILDTCAITLTTDGALGVNGDATELTSQGVLGGLFGTANILTNNGDSTVEVLAPTNWAQVPAAYDGDTTFSTTYSIPVGLNTVGETDGATPTTLGFGNSELVINAKAEKGSGTYGGGTYELVTTVRCTAN